MTFCYTFCTVVHLLVSQVHVFYKNGQGVKILFEIVSGVGPSHHVLDRGPDSTGEGAFFIGGCFAN